MNANTTLRRNEYGELFAALGWCDEPKTSPDDVLCLNAARALIVTASTAGKIPRAHDTLYRDRKGRWDGSALHHEIYDFTASAVLVCLRETEGSKYGVKTVSKEYKIVRRCGRGVTVQDAPKASAAKAAKTTAALGDAIAICLGKKKLAGKPIEKRIGYKLVERTESGYRSCWDGSEWTIGKTRVERAKGGDWGHESGLYYYADISQAIDAAHANAVFGDVLNHRHLAILEVEASGREIQYYGGKLAASRIRPIRDVATTL